MLTLISYSGCNFERLLEKPFLNILEILDVIICFTLLEYLKLMIRIEIRISF